METRQYPSQACMTLAKPPAHYVEAAVGRSVGLCFMEERVLSAQWAPGA